ncbi:MAG: hypothetical protein K8T90_22610 [Planctomycetes bacterium]|nr:hypothetical protein [Planctomycetota bacterium]
MITGTVWGLTLIAVGVVATFAATQIFLAALFPARFERMRDVLRDRPARATVLGFVALFLAIAIATVIGKAFALGGAFLGGGAAFAAVFGMGAVAAELGARLPSTGAAATPWRALVRGSIVCSLVSLLPLAGWFVLFPLLLSAGFGAWLLSFAAAPIAARTTPITTSAAAEAGA